MKFFVFINKRTIIALLLSVLLAFLFYYDFSSVKASYKDAKSNRERILFLKNKGYNIDEDFLLTEDIKIPSKFNSVYNDYNKLQMASGYNLLKYRGIEVIKYTYKLKSSDDFLNLLVYNGHIIGGNLYSKENLNNILPLK